MRPPRGRPAHPLLRDRLFVGLGLAVAASAIIETAVPLPLLAFQLFSYLCSAVSLTCATGFATQVAAGMRGHPGARFWRTARFVVGLLVVSDLLQLGHELATPAPRRDITLWVPSSLVSAVSMLLAISVILTYPVPHDSRYSRHRFWLDMSTVMAATVTFGAYFSAGTLRAGLNSTAAWVAQLAGGPVIVCVVAFGIARLLLSGRAPFTAAAGLLTTAAGAVSGASIALLPELDRLHRPNWFLAMDLTANALVMLGIRAQQVGVGVGAFATGSRRRFSVLPYGAVLAAYGLLIMVLTMQHVSSQTWLVAMGATLCTASVVARQLSSITDNESLLRERESLLEQMNHLAFHDGLTGLANRALFFDRVEVALAQARRSGTASAVLVIDLDDFKPVNDRYGHDVGDAVIVAAAHRMRQQVRESDTVARIGGDEFAIVVGQTSADDVVGLVTRLVAAVSEPVVAGDVTATVGCSVGVGLVYAGQGDSAALLKAADQAMYKVKVRGKGGYALAGGDIHRADVGQG